eukprot:5174026-Prymnesium_polylepis.1
MAASCPLNSPRTCARAASLRRALASLADCVTDARCAAAFLLTLSRSSLRMARRAVDASLAV